MDNNNYIIYLPYYNKGTGFSAEERDKHKLRGLLPARIETIEEQTARALHQFRSFESPIDKYIYLSSLQDRNVTLFFRVLIENLEEAMPIVYTPTVGEGCTTFSHNFRTAKGMYFTPGDRGKFREMLDNWIEDDVNIIVVTDGSRILGLGDLGANGMGIPIGKLSLYVAGAGFNPRGTLPVTFDFGTNNEKFLNDPEYIGCRHHRLEGDAYYDLVDEFMSAVKDKWPSALVQFEDFSNDKCFHILDKYRDQYLCFNDDIQGTGAVVLSGFINSLRVANCSLSDSRLVFFGAGSAGVGVANMIVKLFEEAGFTTEDARKHFYFVDSKGLVATNRPGQLESHKVNFARSDVENATDLKSLYDVVSFVKPTALIGLSGIGQSFTQDVIQEMYKHCKKPIIMALSNPTIKAECSAQQAYEWTEGNAIFASGSPFPVCHINGKTLIPGQGNNMFIFPGLGFGAFLAKCTKVTDLMIVKASKTLSQFVSDERIKEGNIYPAISDIREISAAIATNVIKTAKSEGVSKLEIPDDQLLSWVKSNMYFPSYSTAQ